MKKLLVIFCAAVFASGFTYAGTIKVTSPNGGQELCKGKSSTITWTSTGITKNLKISLLKSETIVGDIAKALPPATTSYTWPVGSYIGGTATQATDYKIRIRVDTTGSTTESDDSDGFFSIMNACLVSRVPTDRPQPLKFPLLAITGIDLVPNSEGFGIIFGYKNVGKGPLPKSSEMPVKPDFRVLIDGKQIEKGKLFIPNFPAQPGWEVKTHFGGWIKYPADMNNQWYIGNSITVYINENQVLGMPSDSQTHNLNLIALHYSFDVFIKDLSFNWKTNELTVYYNIIGKAPYPDKKFFLSFNNLTFESGITWSDKKIKPGSYIQKSKMLMHPNMKYIEFEASAYGANLREDLDQRNNKKSKFFRR